MLSHEKHRFGAEIIAIHRPPALEGAGGDGATRARPWPAAFEKIDAQAMRDTEKRRDRKHRGWSAVPAEGLAAPTPRGRSPRRRSAGARASSATDRSAVKPMGVDEAALAMESSGQEVLVFRDASNETRLGALSRAATETSA